MIFGKCVLKKTERLPDCFVFSRLESDFFELSLRFTRKFEIGNKKFDNGYVNPAV